MQLQLNIYLHRYSELFKMGFLKYKPFAHDYIFLQLIVCIEQTQKKILPAKVMQSDA